MTYDDEAAESLHSARAYAESIVDTVREPLLVLDENLRVQSANRAFYSTFHLAREEAIGRALFDLGNREWDDPALRTRLGEVLSANKVFDDLEFAAEFRSIGPRILCINARAIKGGPRPRLILLAIEDETERRRGRIALQEIDAIKGEEEQVRRRQAEFAHAVRISTVGELAIDLAHDLHQPLSAIANGVEACASYVRSGTFDTRKLLDLLDDASDAALRAGTIVDQLQNFIDKGKPQFEYADLCEIARTVPHLLEHELEGANIVLRFDMPPEPIPILADRIQIAQILVNLVQNAIDSVSEAPRGEHEIRIAAWTERGKAELAVHDTGIGIAGEARERLFEPFFTTKENGLGLGLAIARSILDAHSGRIWMDDHVDGRRGTTIRFCLPRSRSPRPLRKERSSDG